MNKELEQFNINIDDIKENNNLFENINEAIEKMKLHTLSDRFEVVLNNNLIESKEKLTNYRTILGCRISYYNLDKNISFIVREDTKPTYEELEQKAENLQIVLDKIKEKINKMIESNYSALSNPEHTIVGKHKLLELSNSDLKEILKLLEEIE